MTSWKEEGDGDGIATKNLGRALGGTIKNGWQLNHEDGKADCMSALEKGASVPAGCYIPDAIYFATNIGDDGLTAGKGTCIWVDYDSMGRMI
ncbi:MAG: hypothetical protein JXR76_03690, partial [Deltaproteobacteria bacterium]|nr:hypothetical protein [Deltaproteobacteria bacterium]